MTAYVHRVFTYSCLSHEVCTYMYILFMCVEWGWCYFDHYTHLSNEVYTCMCEVGMVHFITPTPPMRYV